MRRRHIDSPEHGGTREALAVWRRRLTTSARRSIIGSLSRRSSLGVTEGQTAYQRKEKWRKDRFFIQKFSEFLQRASHCADFRWVTRDLCETNYHFQEPLPNQVNPQFPPSSTTTILHDLKRAGRPATPKTRGS